MLEAGEPSALYPRGSRSADVDGPRIRRSVAFYLQPTGHGLGVCAVKYSPGLRLLRVFWFELQGGKVVVGTVLR